jgi:hypothetical protein
MREHAETLREPPRRQPTRVSARGRALSSTKRFRVTSVTSKDTD